MLTDISKLRRFDLWFGFSLSVFIFTLPLWREINVIAMWLLGVAWLFTIPKTEKLIYLKKNKMIIFLFGLLYLSYAYLALFSCPAYCEYNQLMQSIGLLLIPLFLLTVNPVRIHHKKIFISLGAGIFTAMLISWADVFYTIYNRPFPFFHEIKYFFQWIYTSGNLLRKIHFHPSYFAVLQVLFISVLWFEKDFEQWKKQYPKTYFLLLFLLILFLIETNSRVAVISFAIIIFVHFIRNFSIKNLFISLLITAIVLVGIWQFDFFHKKIILLLSGEERIYRWKYIAELFFQKPHWFLGLGDKQATGMYLQAYQNGHFDLAFQKQYNAHNQFLELLFKAGIFGFVVFGYLWYYFVKKTKLQKDSLYFFITFIVFSLAESFLQRNKGIFIFAVFYSLYMIFYTGKRNEKAG
jgi:O-antigen ligase